MQSSVSTRRHPSVTAADLTGRKRIPDEWLKKNPQARLNMLQARSEEQQSRLDELQARLDELSGS